MNYTNLQPLRIPDGWTIVFNNSEDIDFEKISSKDDKLWLYSIENLLYITAESTRKQNMQTQTQKTGIDPGWYPDADPKSNYTLYAVLYDNWAEPLLGFTSRSKTEIVNMLKKRLFREFMPPNRFIDEKHFRKNHKGKPPTK